VRDPRGAPPPAARAGRAGLHRGARHGAVARGPRGALRGRRAGRGQPSARRRERELRGGGAMRRGGIRLALAALLLAAAACSSPESAAREAAAASPAALVPVRLPGTKEDVLSGHLEVPENRAVPAGRKLSLNVVVVPALEREPGRAPLLFI